MAYELLTGTLPFTASTAEELAHLHLEAKPIPPREYVPDIPEALQEIILKVLVEGAVGALPDGRSARTRADEIRHAARPSAGSPWQHPLPEVRARNSAPPDPVWRNCLSLSRQRPSEPIDIDWASVGLGLLAVITVGGLIPFWMWIYLVYNPPIK